MLRHYRVDISAKVFLWQWTSTSTFQGYVATVLAELPACLSDFPSVFLSYNKVCFWLDHKNFHQNLLHLTVNSTIYTECLAVLRSELFWEITQCIITQCIITQCIITQCIITQCIIVILYRLFGTTYPSQIQGSKIGVFVSSFVYLTLEDETDRLSRNVGMESPLYAAWFPRRPQISSTSR
jgi:hypothetical protein